MTACVGCGYCCIKTPCDASRRLYGNVKECPQLLWDENRSRYLCGLMIIGGLVGEGYRKELYAGAGCCCGLNSWRQDVRKRTGIEVSTHINPLPKLLQKFVVCLSKEFTSTDSMVLLLTRFASELKKDGYHEDEIASIYNNIVNIFNENRHSFTKGFMG